MLVPTKFTSSCRSNVIMEQSFQLIPILLAILLLFFPVLIRLWKKKPKNNDSTPNPPPGPWKLPIIGNIHQLVGSLPHHALRKLAKKYGPVMQLQIGEVPAVIISSSEAAKEVMKTQEISFAGRPYLLVGKTTTYNQKDIAFAPYGDYWRQMRRICTLELLSAKRVKSFRSIREEEVSNFTRFIYSTGGSVPINFSKMLFDLSMSIIARTSIGKKCKNQEALLSIVEQSMEVAGCTNLVDIFPSSKLLYMISKARSRLEKSFLVADQILENIINERKANKEEIKTDQENEAEDLLDVLLNLQNRGKLETPLTTESTKAIILEMFGAGSDPSSTLMEWIMSELLKNPRIMKKAQEEVRQVFRDTRNVDETGLHNLKFLKLIIKETLRLHPPGAIIPRECINTCKIHGYVIKARTRVMINTWAIGRDSDTWVEAEKFDPERFLDSSIDYNGTDFELIPFGAGKRICPGILFGISSIELPIAQLLYHFDWKLPSGEALEDLDMNEAFGASIKRKHNLNLVMIPHGPSPWNVE